MKTIQMNTMNTFTKEQLNNFSNQWNHFDQSNMFIHLGCTNVNLDTVKFNDQFKSIITYNIGGLTEKLVACATTKLQSKRLVIAQFFSINTDIVEDFQRKFDIGSTLPSHYSLINTLNQDKSKQHQYKIDQVIFVLKRDNPEKFTCTLNIYYHNKIIKSFSGTDNSKSNAKDICVKQFAIWVQIYVTQVAQTQMDNEESNEAAAITGAIVPLQQDQKQETVLTSEAPVASTLPFIPIGGLWANASAATKINSDAYYSDRWAPLNSKRIETSSTASNAPLYTLDLLGNVIQFNSTNPITLLLRQHCMIKFDSIQIKVITTSNSFNLGRGLFSVLPEGKRLQKGDLSSESSLWASYRHVKQAVQRQHVFVDFNSSNEVIIDIPLNTYKSWIPLVPTTPYLPFDYALLDFYMLSPLRVGQDAQPFVNQAFFVRFNNLQVTGLRPTDLLPDFARTQLSQIDYDAEVEEWLNLNPQPELPVGDSLAAWERYEDEKNIWNANLEVFKEELAEKMEQNAKEETESECSDDVGSTQIGPILGSIIVSAATSFFKPIVTGIGNLISGGISSLFGKNMNPARKGGESVFNMADQLNDPASADKPAGVKQPRELRPNALGNVATAVFVEPNMSMRLDPTALCPHHSSLQIHPNMYNIRELLSIWNYYGKFNWSVTNQTVGEELFSIKIQPGASHLRETLIGQLSRFFIFNSGSYEIRFDFISTEKHIGGATVAFMPLSENFTYEQAEDAQHSFIDLRTERQAIINIPFIYPVPLQRNDVSLSKPIGTLKFFVKNSLVPIGQVPQDIEILVFIRCLPDYHFAVPRSQLSMLNCRYEVATTQMDRGDKEVMETPLVPAQLNYSGVGFNIAEDHNLIYDNLRRYVKYKSFPTASVTFDFPINLSFSRREHTLTSYLIQCFRYVRGSLRVIVLISKYNAPPVKSLADIPLIPMDQIDTCANAAISIPTNLVAPQVPTSVNPDLLNVYAGTASYSVFPSNESWWTVGGAMGDREPLRFPKASGLVQDFNNDELLPIVNSLNSLATAQTSNIDVVANNNSSINNNVADPCNTNFTNIKTAMDTNVGLNTFNREVQSTVNSFVECQNNANNVSNLNFQNTNTNNNVLAEAITDSGGQIIAAETPVAVKVYTYQLNNDKEAMTNNATQIVLTDINRSVKLEIPYYNENLYNDYIGDGGNTGDQSTGSLGFLRIEADAQIKIETYLSFADDTRMYSFIGMPSILAPPTEIADTQMDLPAGPSNLEQMIDDAHGDVSLDQFLDNIRSPIKTNFLTSVRDTGYACFSNAKNIVNTPIRMVKTMDKANILMDKASGAIDQITAYATKVVNELKNQFSWITNTSIIINAIIHLMQAFLNPTLPTVLLSIGGILSSLGMISGDLVIKVIQIIKSKLVGNQQQILSQSSTPIELRTGDNADTQCDHDCTTCVNFTRCRDTCDTCDKQRCLFDTNTCSVLGGLIIGSISAAMGIPKNVASDGLFKNLFKITPMFWTSINQTTIFLKNFITVIQRAYNRLLGGNKLTQSLIHITQHRQDLNLWVKESLELTKAINRVAISNSIVLKNRLWLCYAKSFQLQEIYVLGQQPESQGILRLVKKVQDLVDELHVQLTNCPVRYEPFVLALRGKSKIGKSYLINSLIPTILSEAHNYSNYTQPIYTRTTGIKYWNNYVDQPCVYYDDFLCVNDPTVATEQLAEIFNLKSTALFNVNMADITDKKLYANPLIVAMCLNRDFVPNSILDKEAFQRRKDAYWSVELTKDISIDAKLTDHYTSSELENFEHLIFKFIPDPTRPFTFYKNNYTYAQFVAHMIKCVKDYHTKEIKNVNYRFEQLKKTLPEVAKTMTMDTDICSVFYSACIKSAEESQVQTGYLPSEVLNQQLLMVDRLTHLVTTQAEVHADGEMFNIREKIDKFIAYYVFGASHGTNSIDNYCICCQYGGADDTSIEPVELIHYCSNCRVGYCYNCHEGFMRAQSSLTRCSVCHTETMVNAYPRRLMTMKNIVKQILLNSRRHIKSIIDFLIKHKVMIIAMSFGVIIHLLISHLVARRTCTEQEFLSDVFDEPFYGGVTTKWLFGTYDPGKNAPPGQITGMIHPMKINISNNINPNIGHEWGALRIDPPTISNGCTVSISALDKTIPHKLTNDYLNYIDCHNPNQETDILQRINNYHSPADLSFSDYSILRETPYEAHTQLLETYNINGINIYPKPLLKVPSVQDCLHTKFLEELDNNSDYSNLSYSRYPTDNFGVWKLEFSTVLLVVNDAQCNDSCAFNIQKRKNILDNFVREKTAEIKIILREFRTLYDQNVEITLPWDCVNSEFFQVGDVTNILSILEQHRSLSLLDRCKGKIKEYGKYILMGLACISGIAAVFGLMSFFKSNDEQASSQGFPSGDFKTFKSSARNNVRSVFAKTQSDPQHMDNAKLKILRNTIFFDCSYLDQQGHEHKVTIRSIGVFGNFVMLTKHECLYLLDLFANKTKLQGKCKIRFFLNDDRLTVKREIIISKQFAHLTQSDLAFYELPLQFGQFKDLTNLFTPLKSHNLTHRLATGFAAGKVGELIKEREITFGELCPKLVTTPTIHYGSLTSYNVYRTNHSEDGYCGALLLVDSNNPIYALHFAGNHLTHIGYCVPLIKEDIEEFKKTKCTYFSVDIPDMGTTQSGILLEGQYKIIGNVTDKEKVFQASHTKIIPSVINSQIEGVQCVTQPGILSSKDPRYNFEGSPLKWGCSKHCDPTLDLPQDIVEKAYYFRRNKILNIKPLRNTVGKLDIFQAVCGNETNYYDPIKLNTSCGYPLNLNKGLTTKENYIKITRNGNEVATVNIHKDVLESISNLEDNCRNKIRPFVLFCDTLKDERRSERKLKLKDGTRVFSQSPLDFLILCRQYQMDFNSAYTSSRLDSNHAIGINVNSPEWTDMFTRLVDKGDNIISGDFKDFGPKIFSQLVNKVGELRNDWYEEYQNIGNYFDDNVVRNVIQTCISSSYHIVNNLIYQVFSGIPSGHPSTTIENSEAHILLIYCLWLMIMGPLGYTLEDFDKECYLVVYGDDHLLSVSDKVRDQFNCMTISEVLKPYNFIYTDADKIGNIPYTTIMEAKFLKCGFKKHPNNVDILAPIDTQSITECAQWVWKSPDKILATIENAEQSIRLSFGHGEIYFNEWKNKVNKALAVHNIDPIRITWKEIDLNFFPTHHNILPYVISENFDFKQFDGEFDEKLLFSSYTGQ